MGVRRKKHRMLYMALFFINKTPRTKRKPSETLQCRIYNTHIYSVLVHSTPHLCWYWELPWYRCGTLHSVLLNHMKFPLNLLLDFIQIPLDGIPSLRCVNCLTQLGVICQIAKYALDPIIFVTEDMKRYLS